jgi:WD40 repeat protein
MSVATGGRLSVFGLLFVALCWRGESSSPAGQPAVGSGQEVRTDVNGDPLPAGALARIGSLRLRHGAEVEGLAFSADGKVLASVSRDATIRLWEVATGKERSRIDLAGMKLYAGVTITLAADGKTIAFSSQEQTIHVWDTATCKELRQIRWPGLNTNGMGPTILLSADGQLLAAWSNDAKFRLWEVATGKERFQIALMPGHIIARMAFAPDGKVLAVCPGDKSVRLWDTTTGKEVQQLHGHQFGAYALAFAPDGKTLASGGFKQVRLWEVATGQQRLVLGNFKRPVFALAFSADGNTLSAAADDGQCRAWDWKAAKEVRQFSVLPPSGDSANPISKIVFAPDGKLLAWTAWSNRIQLTDAQTGKELLAGSGQPDVAHFALAPDGKTLASPCTDGKLRLWDTASGKEVRAWKAGQGPIQFLHYTPDGKTLITLGKKLQRWDVVSGELREQFDLADGPFLVGPWAVSADAKVLAVGAVNLRGSPVPVDCRITFWDLTTGKKLAQSQAAHKDSVTAVAFSPDGKTLVSAGVDRTLRLWQVETGKEVRQIAGPATSMSRLIFDADGRTILGACSFFDKQGKQALRLFLWETATLQERQQREGPPGPVFFRTFSEDARAFAYTDAAGTIHIEDLASGKQVREFKGHQGQIANVLFSRDRHLLATASQDGTILIWDLAGGAGKVGGKQQ